MPRTLPYATWVKLSGDLADEVIAWGNALADAINQGVDLTPAQQLEFDRVREFGRTLRSARSLAVMLFMTTEND